MWACFEIYGPSPSSKIPPELGAHCGTGRGKSAQATTKPPVSDILPGKSATATGDPVFFGSVGHTRRSSTLKTSTFCHLNAHDPLDCPLCGKVLEGITHFKNHAASVHNCSLDLCPSLYLLRTGSWWRADRYCARKWAWMSDIASTR